MAVFFGFYAMGPRIFNLLVTNTSDIMANDVLVAVPLFLFMGYVVERANILDRLFHSIQLAARNVPGSLATVSPEADYFDLSARWAITDNFTITGVISNVTDEYPPQTADGFAGQGNVDVALYPRPLGREFAISGRYRF